MKLLTVILLLSMLLLIPINVQAYGSYFNDEMNDSSTASNVTFIIYPRQEFVYLNVSRSVNLTFANMTFNGHQTRVLNFEETFSITTFCQGGSEMDAMAINDSYAYFSCSVGVQDSEINVTKYYLNNMTWTGEEFFLTSSPHITSRYLRTLETNGTHWFVCGDSPDRCYVFNSTFDYYMNYTTARNYNALTSNGTHFWGVRGSDREGIILLNSTMDEISYSATCDIEDLAFYNGVIVAKMDPFKCEGVTYQKFYANNLTSMENITTAYTLVGGLDAYDNVLHERAGSAYNRLFIEIDYPSNVTIDICNDGTVEYTGSGDFNSSIELDFIDAIHDYNRDICTSEWLTGFCIIPINITSLTTGYIEISDINLTGETLYGKYNISLKVEDDWDEMFDVTGLNVTLLVYCENGDQYSYNVSGNNYTDLLVYCQMKTIGVSIDYPGDNYVRETLTPGSYWDYEINLYFVDANTDTILQMPIYMDDVNYRTASLELFKTEGENHYTIHSGYFDIENKLLTYLKKDSKYNLRIVKGTETRDINYLYAYAATAQHISLNQISIAPSIRLISDNILMGADFINQSAPNTTMRITYEDLINMTENVRIRVFSDTNNTAFFDQTYTTSNFTISLLEINTSFRYSVHWDLNHSVLGNSPIHYTIGVGGRPGWDLGLPAELEWLYVGFTFFIIMATSWIITPEIRFPGYILLLVELAVLGIGQWAIFGTAPLALFITFIVAGIIYEIRHKGVS